MSQLVENKKVIVILPAYNAEKTLAGVINDVPKGWVDDLILVDDKSSDKTVEVSKSLGLKTFCHEKNKGYGANQKTCYKKALELGADIVVMLHPDHQYDPKLIPEIIKPLAADKADAVFGSRMMIRKNALLGGMPYWKYLSNIFLTKVENFVLGLNLTDCHSGFRAYSAKTLKSVAFEKNSDNFAFDAEIIVQLKIAGLAIGEIPIATKYFSEAGTMGFWQGVRYGLTVFEILFLYIFHQLGIRNFKQE